MGRTLGQLYWELEDQMRGTSGATYQFFKNKQDEVFKIMSDRNEQGQAYEKAGHPDKAIPLYEANVRDDFFGMFPYDRLRILYTKQKRFADGIRVCEAYLALPGRGGQDKPKFRHHREKLQARLEKEQCK